MNKKIFYAVVALLVLAVAGFLLTRRKVEAPTTPASQSSALSTPAKYTVTSETVAYDGQVNGYFAHPQTAGHYPGVVMVHEWWGLNDNIKTMASQLAGQGYNVLAVDLYHGQVTSNAAQATKLMTALNQTEATQNLQAAVDFLRGQGSIKIGDLGWCFGGGQALQLAISGEKLNATVIYYGELTSDQTKLKAITWPILGIFGDKDQTISVASVNTFDSALTSLHIMHNIQIYHGVGHAFANPSNPGYAPNETKDAWGKTLEFLQQNLR